MASISEQIAQQYQSSLSRTPDSDGLNYWTNEVEAGRLTLDQAKNAIANSQEAKITKDLKDTYGTYLERDADAEGLQYWKDEVNTGNLSLDQAKIAIATSPDAQEVDPVKSATASLYNQVLQRAPDEEGLNYFSDEIKTGLQSGADSTTVLQNVATSLASSEEKKIQNVNTVNNLITRATEGDLGAYGEFLYLARKSDIPVQEELIEQIGYGSTDDKTAAYNYSVGAQAYAEGLEALDQARESGDTTKITELESALANPQGFFDYYNANVADKEGQAQINLRKETADGNPFKIGDPGEYQTSFFERIGDVGQDILENPVFQMALALNPVTAPFAPFIGALTTKLSGDEISGLQVAGMLASAPGAFDQASTLAGTKYNTGMFSPQSVELFSQQAGLEPSFLDIGENISSGITTESDLLRGAQQGAVSGAAAALSGASDVEIAKAVANKQLIDLGLEGALSNVNIPGLDLTVGDIANFDFSDITIPGLGLNLGDISARLPFDIGELKAIAGAIPDFDLGSLPELPELAGIRIGDLQIGDMTLGDIDLSGIDLGVNLPDFEVADVGTVLDDFGIDIDAPDINIPKIPLPELRKLLQIGLPAAKEAEETIVSLQSPFDINPLDEPLFSREVLSRTFT